MPESEEQLCSMTAGRRMRTGRYITGSCDCCGAVMSYCYCCISGGIPPTACGGEGGSMAYGELLERRAIRSRVTRRRGRRAIGRRRAPLLAPRRNAMEGDEKKLHSIN
ncbi:hypothetical protein PR202_gb14943 [Eleusine coracana subsp. coracana]|uniref:Uncharacterized protein n=1 Tax=Eleusine coracana subsp. coracana TaxID=191504 RepID=A0AAV5EWL7_ELECO|nr:hypothetical protein PR202_gb14943 [Eleusine coracana subsp. coracana]